MREICDTLMTFFFAALLVIFLAVFLFWECTSGHGYYSERGK